MTRTANNWRTSTVGAVLTLLAFLAIQFAIPISRIASSDEGTPRFAWHMFSVSRPKPTFVVETSEASEPIELADHLAKVRDDLDFESVIPPHLCDAVPSAEAIVWETGRYEC